MVGRLSAGYIDGVYTNGDHAPSTSQTAGHALFESWSFGALPCLNMNSFTSHYVFGPAATQAVKAPELFALPNWDAAAMVADLASTGKVDYCVFTVENEIGFPLWNSWIDNGTQENYTPGNKPGGFISPAYRKYDTEAGGVDINMVAKWATACRQAGIEPIPYLNIVDNMNIMSGNISQAGGALIAKHVTFICRALQELLVKYGFRYVWLDNYSQLDGSNMQAIYNAVKAIDPTCLVICNPHGESDFGSFPYDIQSTEEYRLSVVGINSLANPRTYSSTDYYIPHEVVGTLMENEQYYWVNPALDPGDMPSYTPLEYRPLAEIQTIYETCRDNDPAVRLLMGFPLDMDGQMTATQLSRINGLTL
jgi:hypothetical protein